MSYYLKYLMYLAFLLSGYYSMGQTSKSPETPTHSMLMQQAVNYFQANRSGEALECVDKALELASSREEIMRSLLFKGELFRATENHSQALDVLWQLTGMEFNSDERSSQIRAYGRLAAVHQELGEYPLKQVEDSVRHYLEQALYLSSQDPESYPMEIASLYNELGMFVYRRGHTAEARKYYTIACEKFNSLNEEQHLITPLSNLLELESCQHNLVVADSLAQALESLIEDKEWFTQMIGAYYSLCIYANTKQDAIAELEYKVKYLDVNLSHANKANSDKMLALSELYERDKLQKQVHKERIRKEENARKLENANTYRRQLIAFLAIALFCIVGIVVLFLRERRTKMKINSINDELNAANERYHLLVIESNHRIKNNLQMIIGMLEYTKKGIDSSSFRVINSISGKINTISALHKHLYVDMHNEFIPVSTYFQELTKLYKGIAGERFHVDLNADGVKIRSERIVYFGLIFNEMLSNTIEHSNATIDKIKLHIKATNGEYQFSYSDASSRSHDFTPGTGSELIKNLVVRVGGKNFTLDPNLGLYQFNFTVKL